MSQKNETLKSPEDTIREALEYMRDCGPRDARWRKSIAALTALEQMRKEVWVLKKAIAEDGCSVSVGGPMPPSQEVQDAAKLVMDNLEYIIEAGEDRHDKT